MRATSRDHHPLPSLDNRWDVALQLLKVPTTATPDALGAHVRNVTPSTPGPSLNGMAPTPARMETCATAGIANTAAPRAAPAIVRIEIFKCRLQGHEQRGLSGATRKSSPATGNRKRNRRNRASKPRSSPAIRLSIAQPVGFGTRQPGHVAAALPAALPEAHTPLRPRLPPMLPTSLNARTSPSAQTCPLPQSGRAPRPPFGRSWWPFQ